MLYRNFDIWLEAQETTGRYHLRAASELFGEASGQIGIQASDQTLRKGLERVETRQTDREGLIEMGTWLYDHLLPDNIKALFIKSLGEAEAKPDYGVRLRLRIGVPTLSRLPWELLYSPAEARFLATLVENPVVRYLEIPRYLRKTETPLPLRLLVAIPESVEPFPPLSAQEETAGLMEAANGLDGLIEIHCLEGRVTCDSIAAALLEKEFQVFHFIGHGTFRDDKGYLVLNREEGGADPVDENRFAGLFQNHPSLKLVTLNACKGARVSSTRPLSGLGPRLVELGIPAVVAMQFPVYDRAAILFARAFYRSLLKGVDKGRIEVAVSHARNALAGEMPDERELGAPVLFMHCRDGVLFNPLSPRWWQNLAFSSPARHTERLVESTHRTNLTLLAQAGREHPDDETLKRERLDEESQLNRLQKRKRTRNFIVGAAITVALLMFFLAFIRAFDIFDLDTRVETLTIAVGDPFTSKAYSPDLAVVALDGETEKLMGREFHQAPKSWRPDHAELIAKLAKAGAKVIAVGINLADFDPRSAADIQLKNAIETAISSGTDVILSSSKVAEPLRTAASGSGFGCIGKRLGLAATVPLAVEEAGKTTALSLAVAAVSAYQRASPEMIASYQIDHARRTLKPSDRNSEEFGFSERTRSRYDQSHCSAIHEKAQTADLLLSLSPLEALRDPARYHSYGAILGEEEPTTLTRYFQNKIVLIGAVTPEERFRTRTLDERPRYGYDLYADALNALLLGKTPRPLAPAVQFAAILAMALMGGLLQYRSGRLRSRVLTAISFAYLLLAVTVYSSHQLLLNPLYHIGALWLTAWIGAKAKQKWMD